VPLQIFLPFKIGKGNPIVAELQDYTRSQSGLIEFGVNYVAWGLNNSD
jgi:hypothetical protein